MDSMVLRPPLLRAQDSCVRPSQPRPRRLHHKAQSRRGGLVLLPEGTRLGKGTGGLRPGERGALLGSTLSLP